ncbi:hypothetical protein AZ66_16730 [Paenibacillus sp. E194]|uniref:hypothetical protein n=1 Tax=Paenibacillus sp. E194 TaxID=1458845 RepID=UPI0005CB1A0B|nr:hypothetical protein [Paenibacillus sp. E194]KJB86805.1 hypothetical protein AZ66_16730 [Paenibacillus sp. E194]
MSSFWNAVISGSKQQKIMLGVFVCLFVVTLLELELIDMMTIHYHSTGRTSGNGNIGLIAILLFVPFYLLLLALIGTASGFVYMNRLSNKKSNSGFLIFLIGISIGLGLVQRFVFMREGVPDDVSDNSLLDYLLTPYMNSAFFNLFTYLLGIIFTIVFSYFIALLIHSLRNKQEVADEHGSQ